MIPQEEIDQLGGDWGQYGELTGTQLITLMNESKLSIVFADKGLIVAIQRPDGAVGRYNLKHTDLADF